MAKKRILLAACAVLLTAGTLGSGLPSHSTDVRCSSTRSLDFSNGRASSGQTTSSPLCFEIYVSPDKALLTVALQPSRGEFDLYLASGRVTTLTETDHKLNFFDTIKDDRSTFAFPNPFGYYTIAVVPRRNNSEFDLTVLTGGSTSDPQASTAQASCPPGAQVCSKSSAITSSEANDKVQIGLDRDDRVLFPIEVACPGKITATATWRGSARRLSLIVNGPERPELFNPVAYYARENGRSPLTVQYTVTSADVERGNRWLVSLVNFDGGTAEGRVEITYPDPSACPSVVVAPKLIDFDTWPDGRKITRTQILGGSEFSELGITVAAAPLGSYCSDARTAVRVDRWASVPYLSTARPTQLNACNGVPVRIDFTKPVKSVTLSFIGAAETYTLTAYDSRGNRLGTASKSGQLDRVVTVTYKSPSANIGRITFGLQAAVTVITTMTVEIPQQTDDIRQDLNAPRQLSPANGTVFSHYPRTTTLQWFPLSGAAKYTVEIDCYHCCQANKWCTDVGQTHKVVPNLRATTYTFNFVGAQPGRWRVWAVDAAGREGRKSDWWEFRYTR